jgi:hypothetical protein
MPKLILNMPDPADHSRPITELDNVTNFKEYDGFIRFDWNGGHWRSNLGYALEEEG